MLTVKDIVNKRFTRDDFVFFWGHTARKERDMKRCLSQWYPAPMVANGIYYNCMEQYLMAAKARTFGDDATLAEIMTEHRQMAIKRLGRKVKNYDNKVWGEIRQEVSVQGNLYKFAQNPNLKEYLLSTGNKILVEASPKDNIWGIGLEESDPNAPIPSLWKGDNLLGFALMEVRARLRRIENRLEAIISAKDEDDPWPPKDFIEFCTGNKFTQLIEWTHEGSGLFEGIRSRILETEARYADKIMIDMRYGRGFPMIPMMFFEQLHAILDPVAAENDFEFIFSLSPDIEINPEDNQVYFTMFA